MRTKLLGIFLFYLLFPISAIAQEINLVAYAGFDF